MNTSQKLTLGIAAIFMVTLTIVGVTYAYFVTRVSGDTTQSVSVQTAQVGSVKYEAGNGDDENDLITLDGMLPGDILYKSFKVTNESADSLGSYYMFMESWADADAPQFVHGTKGATTDSDCYKSTAKPSNDGGTAGCFDSDKYNNLDVTLYEVDKSTFDSLETAPDEFDDSKLKGDGPAREALNEDTEIHVNSGSATTHTSQDLYGPQNIEGSTTKYYIARIEYVDFETTNQNIENEAKLTIKLSIR